MKTLAKREAAPPQPKKTRNALSVIERRITDSLQDEFGARIQTGIDLAIIKDDELFRDAGCKTFNEYIDLPNQNGELRFIFDSKEALRRIKESTYFKSLQVYAEKEKITLPLPDSSYKLRVLTPLPVSKAVPSYFRAVQYAQKCEIPPTAEFIAEFMRNGSVEVDADVTPSEKPQAKHRVLEDPKEPFGDVVFSEEEDPLEELATKIYSPDALKALERIEKFSEQSVFPKEARKAVENEHVFVDPDDLAMWGRMPDEVFVPVGRILFRKAGDINFTAARRFVFESNKPDFWDKSVLYAIAHGPKIHIPNHNGFRIDIQPTIK